MWGPMICLICRSYLNHKLIKVRGGVTKKNGKIWEKFPKGGGVEKADGNSQFQFGNCENPGGGLDFSEMSEL